VREREGLGCGSRGVWLGSQGAWLGSGGGKETLKLQYIYHWRDIKPRWAAYSAIIYQGGFHCVTTSKNGFTKEVVIR
jgi:hypothetical protein